MLIHIVNHIYPTQQHRGSGFDPMYRQISTGSDDQLKLHSHVIGSVFSGELKNPKDVLVYWSSLILCLSVIVIPGLGL